MNASQKSEALRLAGIVERRNAGVHSQAIAEEYSAAARELRSQHARIAELEDVADMAIKRVAELEAQLAAIGAQAAQPDTPAVLGWVRRGKNGRIGNHFYTYEPHCDVAVRDDGGEKIPVIAAKCSIAQNLSPSALHTQASLDQIGPDADGEPDAGNIHANIRAMKEHICELEKTLLLTRFATGAPADAKREVLPLFSGAIYDFAGFLTTRNRTIEVGSTANASHICELIKEWSTLRGLDISTTNIDAWSELLDAVRQDTPTDSGV